METDENFFKRTWRRVRRWFTYDPFGYRLGMLLSFLLVPVILAILLVKALYNIVIEMAEMTKYTIDDIIDGPSPDAGFITRNEDGAYD